MAGCLKSGVITLLILAVIAFSAGISHAAVYYVSPSGNDGNNGSEGQPWKTLQKAAGTLVAGDTVYLRAGTYNEQLVPVNSGSAGNYITYSSYPGETAVIDGSTGVALSSEWQAGLVQITNRSYIRISRLKVMNAGPHPDNNGILVEESSNIIIENNHTYNTVSSGIGVWGGSNVIVDGNEVELACNDGEQECITVAGTDTFEVRNNHVHHAGPGTNGGEGIDAKDGSRNGKIFKNHVHHTNSDRTCLYVDSWDKTTDNIEVYKNTLHDCGAGITLASESGGLLTNVSIHNNIVYSNRANGLEIGNWGVEGVTVRPVENVIFINNTAYNNGSSGWGAGFLNENPDVSNIVVRNNIFSQNATSQIVNESTASVTVDHNLIDGTQGYQYAINGADYVTGDPLFVNSAAADFHLRSGSPAINRGSSVSAPATDFDGDRRPFGSGVDIGADEYSTSTRGLSWLLLLLY